MIFSGTPNGNKLIEMIWYPQMWRCHFWKMIFCPFNYICTVNLFLYDQNIFGSPSVVFGNLGNLWKMSRNLREMFWNVHLALEPILDYLWEVVSNVLWTFSIIKRKLQGHVEIWNFLWVLKYFLTLKHKCFISTQPCNILY